MTQNNKLFNIVSGPSKWDFIIAFVEFSGRSVDFQYFTTNSKFKVNVNVAIKSLEHIPRESVDDLNFTAIAALPDGRRQIKGRYNMHTRKGHFEVVS